LAVHGFPDDVRIDPIRYPKNATIQQESLMLRMIRIGLWSLAAMGFVTVGQAQQPAAAPGGNAPSVAAQAIPGGGEVLATVTSRNLTDQIKKADVIDLLSRNNVVPPPEEREIAYNRAIEVLVNTKLLKHFLSAQRVDVPESRVEEQIERAKQQLKQQGQDLPTLLVQNGSSLDEMRKEIANNIRLEQYITAKASDAALRRYLNENRDRFAGTQVRASHILLRVEPSADKSQKEKIKQKLEAIRKEIVDGKISFAAAANKYSEDPANGGNAGGDLDYFTLNSGFVDEFADAAFKLKKGEVSQPVETPFGFHLIQVTDRKEQKLPDFEQIKPLILRNYSMELQKEIIEEERKAAKIDIKPMPKDLFPSEPPAAAPGATAPAAGAVAAPKP
jgi:parvulin-like peptidyl-prolyl isomerase